MNLTQSPTINVLLDKHAHHYARLFAAEQANPQKGKRVYLNTLAVYAVYSYLKWLAIKTSLDQSDCWHPGLRAIFDIADLVLPNIGKLECRPLLPGEKLLLLPSEVIENRIGYVVVEFTEELDKVQLLGFLPSNYINQLTEAISVEQLQPLDNLINKIYQEKLYVNLRQWLQGIFQQEWQPLDSLLPVDGIALRTLGKDVSLGKSKEKSISRGKVIDWESDRIKQIIILVININYQPENQVDICLRLYPEAQNTHLPLGLQVTVLNQLEIPCMEAQTRNTDDWIELEFSCQPEEKFTVKMVLDQVSMIEYFIV